MAERQPVETAKIRWKRSCVRLVKRRPLPNVARANVVHQALPEIQAKTAKMVNLAKMETTVAQAKMLKLKNNFCRYLLNATATLHQAAQEKLDPKDPMDHQAMQEIQAVMDNQDLKDPQAHQAHQANLEKPDLKDPTAMLEL